MKDIKVMIQKTALFSRYFLPRFLQRAVYLFPLVILNKRFEAKFWARHSVAEGFFVFGKSDLDITCFLGTNVKAFQIDEIFKFLITLKSYIPFIGETRVVTEDDLPLYENYGNYFELKRDPKLLKSLKLLTKVSVNKERPYQESERWVYLLNWLKNDCHQLLVLTDLRKGKVEQTLKLLGVESVGSGLRNLKDIFRHIRKTDSGLRPFLSDLKDSEAFLSQFCAFWNKLRECESPLKRDELLNEYYSKLEDKSLFLLFFPSLWLGASLSHQRVEADLDKLRERRDLSGFIQIIFCQLSWEIVGLCGQRWFLPKGNLMNHIENLTLVVKKLRQDYPALDWDFLLKGLNELAEKVQ